MYHHKERLMNRLASLIVALFILAACGSPQQAPMPTTQQTTTAGGGMTITVYKSPTCGCCHEWIAYLKRHGVSVIVHDVADLADLKQDHAIPASLQSCHTALVDGYVIEGHVPLEDITRLRAERPAVAGIAVAGMPLGSPGMEVEGQPAQPFDVLTFDRAGATSLFTSYGR